MLHETPSLLRYRFSHPPLWQVSSCHCIAPLGFENFLAVPFYKPASEQVQVVVTTPFTHEKKDRIKTDRTEVRGSSMGMLRSSPTACAAGSCQHPEDRDGVDDVFLKQVDWGLHVCFCGAQLLRRGAEGTGTSNYYKHGSIRGKIFSSMRELCYKLTTKQGNIFDQKRDCVLSILLKVIKTNN